MPLTARIVRRVNGSLRLQIALAVLIAAALGVFIRLTAVGVNAYWPTPAAVIYAGLFLLSMLLLIMERRFDALMLLAAAICLCCGMYARVTMLGFQSSDYVHCLLPWTKKLGSLPLREALSTPIGDYNLPYLYFLTILSRTGWDELLHIKSMSCFFDVVLAYLVMRITALEVKDRRLQLASFLIVHRAYFPHGHDKQRPVGAVRLDLCRVLPCRHSRRDDGARTAVRHCVDCCVQLQASGGLHSPRARRGAFYGAGQAEASFVDPCGIPCLAAAGACMRAQSFQLHEYIRRAARRIQQALSQRSDGLALLWVGTPGGI